MRSFTTPSAALVALSALAAAAASAAQGASVTAEFTGTGTISVLNGTNGYSSTPAEAVGCLDAAGQLTADTTACAEFTAVGASAGVAKGLATASGNCTFYDDAAPKNTDSSLGNVGEALRCLDHVLATDDTFYTISGFDYPYLCYRDTDCYVDAAFAPNSSSGAADVWQFFWSGEQLTVPTGHLKGILLWAQAGRLDDDDDDSGMAAAVASARMSCRRPSTRRRVPCARARGVSAAAILLISGAGWSMHALALSTAPPTHWTAGNPVAGSAVTFNVGYLGGVDQGGVDDNGAVSMSNVSVSFDGCAQYVHAFLGLDQVDLYVWRNDTDNPGCFVKKYTNNDAYTIIWGGDLNWVSNGRTFDDNNYGNAVGSETLTGCAALCAADAACYAAVYGSTTGTCQMKTFSAAADRYLMLPWWLMGAANISSSTTTTAAGSSSPSSSTTSLAGSSGSGSGSTNNSTVAAATSGAISIGAVAGKVSRTCFQLITTSYHTIAGIASGIVVVVIVSVAVILVIVLRRRNGDGGGSFGGLFGGRNRDVAGKSFSASSGRLPGEEAHGLVPHPALAQAAEAGSGGVGGSFMVLSATTTYGAKSNAYAAPGDMYYPAPRPGSTGGIAVGGAGGWGNGASKVMFSERPLPTVPAVPAATVTSMRAPTVGGSASGPRASMFVEDSASLMAPPPGYSEAWDGGGGGGGGSGSFATTGVARASGSTAGVLGRGDRKVGELF
ncbi:hypothetical protein HK405_012620 [Cladochytrium tenue]|nr:hypothetical protein HK405_012620 [Cladochytrium tenue]